MKPLFNHSLLTSFALYLDHVLLDSAQAYANVTGLLYPQKNSGVYGNVWAAPFKSWVADSCVEGATIMSGVYNSSGQFLTPASGIVLDYINGRVMSPQNWGNRLSGVYARKEYNVYTSTEGEIDWWLERVYGENKNIAYTLTGLPVEGRFVAPCIILTNASEYNDPWALGGMQLTTNTIRGYIISSSHAPWAQEGVNSITRDMSNDSFALLSYADMPYGGSGDLKTGYYCYSDLCASHSPPQVYIQAVHNLRLSQKSNSATSFSVSVVEFDVNTVRQPRANYG